MIERYALPPLRDLWTDEAQYQRWLTVELAAIAAREELGETPRGTAEAIRSRVVISVEAILERERVSDHDVVAFIETVTEGLPPELARWFHTGLTSSDIVDTALALALAESLRHIIAEADRFVDALRVLAFSHQHTITMGRTHGIHAEPTSFGAKMLGHLAEAERNAARLRGALAEISHGKMSGSVGNYANLSPRIEELALASIGLVASKCSTQVVPRDHHASMLNALALHGAGIERFAVEIRHLQRTEVGEAQEAFRKGQKGSSSMPHKKNPILCERLCGMARLLRSHAGAGLENIALWHERDISHSSIERIILPDATMTAFYMGKKAAELAAGLIVRPERMTENVGLTRNVIFSQRLMIALIDKGMERLVAYEFVQSHALAAWNSGEDFRARVSALDEVKSRLNESEIAAVFDPAYYLRNIDALFARFS